MTTIAAIAAARGAGSRRPPGPSPSLHAHMLQYIDKARGNVLYPHRRATVVAQASGDNTKLAMANAGEGGTSDGGKYPVLIPYITTQTHDSYGQAIPGAPAAGDDTLVRETRPQNPIIYGKPSPAVSKLPFMTDLSAGNGITRTEYGQYDVGGINPGTPDPVVLKPQITVKPDVGIDVTPSGVKAVAGNGILVNAQGIHVRPKPTAAASQPGGLDSDASGVAVSLATSSGLDTQSGLKVQTGDGMKIGGDGKVAVQTASVSGLVVDGSNNLVVSTGTGISVSGGNVQANAGAGVGVDVSNNLQVKAGPGIGFDGSSNVQIKAGQGLGFDGSSNLQVKAGTGLGFDGSGNLINTSPGATYTAGNGISIASSVISAKIGIGLAWDTSQNIAVALVPGNGIVYDGATATVSTNLYANGGIAFASGQLAIDTGNASFAPSWYGVHWFYGGIIIDMHAAQLDFRNTPLYTSKTADGNFIPCYVDGLGQRYLQLFQ